MITKREYLKVPDLPDNVEEWTRVYGDDGWELVALVPNQASPGFKGYFKRPWKSPLTELTFTEE